MHLPKGWDEKELRDLVTEVQSGFAFKPIETTTGIPHIRPLNINSEGQLSLENSKVVPEEDIDWERHGLVSGDVLFNNTNSKEWVGKTAIYKSTIKSTFSNHITRLRFKKNILPEYAWRILTQLQKDKKFQNLSHQWVNQAAISKDELLSIKIPVPPLPTQQKIVSILEKVESIKQKRQKIEELTNQVLESIFVDMFGEFNSNIKQLKTVKIGDICNLVRGSSPRPKGDPRYYGGSIPRLLIQDITRDGRLVSPCIDFLTESGAKLSRPVSAGTIVMTVSGGVGVTSKLAIDACIHDGFVAFKNLDSSIEPDYLMFALKQLKGSHREAGAIFKNLTTTQVKNTQIFHPSKKDQENFVKIVNKLEEMIQKQTQNQRFSEELFNVITQKAFSGELG